MPEKFPVLSTKVPNLEMNGVGVLAYWGIRVLACWEVGELGAETSGLGSQDWSIGGLWSLGVRLR